MISLSVEKKKQITDLYQRLEQKFEHNAVALSGIIPYKTENGKYCDMVKKDISWWTNGFFGGIMWLLYEHTGKSIYKVAAQGQEAMLDGALRKYDGLHHDVGFMWGLTAKASYILDKNAESRVRSLYAANTLAARVNIRGKYIKSWNQYDYTIIDSLMNLSLLYWAAQESGDDRYKYIAVMHADSVLNHHVREDGSVVHIALHDTQEDKIIETLAGQGCKVGSAWSRGQAWAVYGFMISYLHTAEQKYLDAAMKTADYFIRESKKRGYRVPTDFRQPDDINFLDNSASACAICGIIEIYKAVNDVKYLDAALKLISALEVDCNFTEQNQSILQNCMESYSAGKQTDLIYADFFLCEAVLKLLGSDFFIW